MWVTFLVLMIAGAALARAWALVAILGGLSAVSLVGGFALGIARERRRRREIAAWRARR